MEYYATIKRNEPLKYAAPWMDLKGIMPSEKYLKMGQPCGSTYVAFSKCQNYRNREHISGCQA